MEKSQTSFDLFDMEKLYYKSLYNISSISELLVYKPEACEEILKLDTEIVDTIHRFKTDSKKLLGDFLMVLEINIVSTCFKYLALYLYSIRNKIQKLTESNLECLNFRLRISALSQIYETPDLISIVNFNLETALKDTTIDFQQRRNINCNFNLQIKDDLKGKELEELEMIVSEYEEYMAYPHELVILTFHEYYKKHRETMREIFENEEIFPLNIKYYFAIIAAASVKSYYCFKLFEYLYIQAGGEEIWLMEGIKATPQKIQSIACLVNKLAYSCWTITVEDIKVLFKHNKIVDWNSKELVYVVCLIVQVQKISLIAETVGLSSYYHDAKCLKNLFELNYEKNLNPINDIPSSCEEEKLKNIEKLKERLDEINKITSLEEDGEQTDLDKKKINNKKTEVMDDCFHKSIKIKEIDASPIIKDSDFKTSLTSLSFIQGNKMDDIFGIYLADSNKRYTDFDVKIFDYESNLDFSWEDQAYHILRDVVENPIECIHKETEFCFEMTFDSLGPHNKINTKHIRFAMCVYIEKIYGLEREDYNYSLPNKLLFKEDKTFLKFVACYPEKINSNIIDKVNFTQNEILHTILLVTNSKLTTQLRFFANRFYKVINSME